MGCRSLPFLSLTRFQEFPFHLLVPRKLRTLRNLGLLNETLAFLPAQLLCLLKLLDGVMCYNSVGAQSHSLCYITID